MAPLWALFACVRIVPLFTVECWVTCWAGVPADPEGTQHATCTALYPRTAGTMVTRSGFGNIHRRPSKRNTKYLEASYTPPVWAYDKWPDLMRGRNGEPKKRISKRFPAGFEAEARRWLNEAEAAIIRGTWEPPARAEAKDAAAAVTFGEYATAYVDSHRKRNGEPIAPTTKDKYRQYLRDYLLPVLGNIPMAAINESDIQRWADSMPVGKAGEGLSIKNHVYQLLHGIFTEACTKPWGDSGAPLLNRDPIAIHVDKPSREVANGSATIDDIRALADNMPRRHALIIYMLGVLGMRPGEAEALQRKDITMDGDGHAVIHITKSAKRVTNGDGRATLTIGSTKTRGSVRDLDVPPSLVPLIRAHLDTYVDAAPCSMLFTGERTRGIVNQQTIRNEFYRARAHVPRLEACKFRLYDLRHSALTRIGHMTNSMAEVMSIGGHTQTKTAMRYQHSLAGERRRIVDVIDAELSAQDATRPPDTERQTTVQDGATVDPVALAGVLAAMPAGMRATIISGYGDDLQTRILLAMPKGTRMDTIKAMDGTEE